MKSLVKYWRKSRTAMVMTIVSILISLPTIVITNYTVRWISNIIDDQANMWYWVALVLGGYIYNIISAFAIQYLGRVNIYLLYNKLLEEYMEKVLNSEYNMYTKLSTSHIVTVQEQISTITSSIKLVSAVVSNILTVITLFINLYTINKKIIVPVVIIYSISLLFIKYEYRVCAILDQQQAAAKRIRNQEVHDCINGFSEVRAFVREDSHLSSITNKNNAIFAASVKKAKGYRIMTTLFNVVNFAVVLVALLYVINGVTNGTITGSLGITTIVVCTSLLNPLVSIIEIGDVLSATMAMMPQFDQIMNWENQEDGTIELVNFNNSIELKNVGFKYEDSEKILNNVNLTIKKGQKIGICGASGGGKSTIIKLLCKFYTASEGSILVDGIDVKDLSAKSLRKHIGLVSQDTYIFNGTIKENVAYGKPFATEYEIIDACKKAGLYDFIQTLPEQFETQVGPKGLKLSGGQKQRIAIARIFLTDPDIILLDEATSALDNESEQIVQESLTHFSDKTIVSVAHRLTTIQDSDLIVVLDNHSIAESGTHQELMNKDSIYRKLYKKVK